MISNDSKKKWVNRKRRIRKRVEGTRERPRLSVYRSSRHMYAQVVDDSEGCTLVFACTLDKELKDQVKGIKKLDAAEKVGSLLAKRCAEKSIEQVVFDRNGFIYGGRVAKLADAARKAGLKF